MSYSTTAVSESTNSIAGQKRVNTADIASKKNYRRRLPEDELAWEAELQREGKRANAFVSIVGASLVPLHIFTTDFLDPDERFSTLSIVLRTAVPVFVLIIAWIDRKFPIRSEVFGYASFLAVSLADGYMASIASIESLQTHWLGYSVVLIGTNLFFMWKVIHSIISISISMGIVVVLFAMYTKLPFIVIASNGGFFTLFICILSCIIMYRRYVLTKENFLINLSLKRSYDIIAANEVELQAKNEELQEKNEDITSSILYAQRLQRAVLPQVDFLYNEFQDGFVLYIPRDIISGDWYWFGRKGSRVYIAAADCTGHGVPGALISIVGSNHLKAIISENIHHSPDKILAEMHYRVQNTFKQEDNKTEVLDGMDMALCCIEKELMKLTYAGANRPLYIQRGSELMEIKPDKKPIGGKAGQNTYTLHEIMLQTNDMLYMFSDGITDQFGGENGRKFTTKRFLKTISEIAQNEPDMQAQMRHFNKIFQDWKGKYAQTDDVLLVGVKI